MFFNASLFKLERRCFNASLLLMFFSASLFELWSVDVFKVRLFSAYFHRLMENCAASLKAFPHLRTFTVYWIQSLKGFSPICYFKRPHFSPESVATSMEHVQSLKVFLCTNFLPSSLRWCCVDCWRQWSFQSIYINSFLAL